MAAAQPPFSAKQNGIEIVRYLAIMLVAGFLAHMFIPANASKTLTLFVMFAVGVPSGFVNAWASSRSPAAPSAPAGRANFAG